MAALKQRASSTPRPDESGLTSEGTGETETPGGEASEEIDAKLAEQIKAHKVKPKLVANYVGTTVGAFLYYERRHVPNLPKGLPVVPG